MKSLKKYIVSDIRALALVFPILLTVWDLSTAQAKIVGCELTIAKKVVNITGKPIQGMTINDDIPRLTLHLKEGDNGRIHVHNRMNAETSILFP